MPRFGTINQLSNHPELENHVYAKTCAVRFMRNHACTQGPNLPYSPGRNRFGTFRYGSKIKRQEQYKA